MLVLKALLCLHLQEMEFVTNITTLSKFQGYNNIYTSCKRYCKLLSIIIRYPDKVFNIYLYVNQHKQ